MACGVGACATGGSSGQAGPTHRAVRVLLASGPGPFRIAGTDTGDVTVSASPQGVRVDGVERGATVRLTGPELAVDGLHVRGALDVARSGSGLLVVNDVSLEDYVAGTIARETYTSWGSEVLRAQAVVTRTYVLHERARRTREPWDVRSTTASQVYGGASAENEAVLRASNDTRGEYLAFRDEPILAVFHSASGGGTSGAGEVWREARPYLEPVEVDGEDISPDTYWRVPVSRERLSVLGAKLDRPVGAVSEVRVEERSPSGRVKTVRIEGSQGAAIVSADQLRAALGEGVLRSTRFEVHPGREPRPEDFVFVGSGRGHGVGMSQWGARAMAQRGAGYREILAHFYPGTALRRTEGSQ